MFPMEHRILKYLVRVYSSTEALDYIKLLNIARPRTPEHFLSALDHLVADGYIKNYTFSQNRLTAVSLTIKGFEYTGRPTRDTVLRWVMANLLAILSLMVSIAALIVSVTKR